MKSSYYLILLIVSAFVLRIYAVFEWKQNFSNDESVTYLAATGNEVRYANLANPDSSYLNNYTKINIWKDCYVSSPPLCFKKIAEGLAQYDIHPPLYFWLMHCFVLLFGLHLYTGLILNLIISLFTLFALYRLANFIFNSSAKATLVCAIWFLSPAVVQMDLEARHYQLFALFAMLLSYIALKVLNNKTLSNKNMFFIILFSTLGMLTHYYFTFIIIGVFLLFFIRLRFSKMMIKVAGCFVASAGLFLLIFPQFIDFIKNYMAKKGSVKHVTKHQSFIDKIKTQLYATLDFGAYGHLIKYFYLLALVVFVCALVYKIYKSKRGSSLFSSGPVSNILFLFFWNVFFTFVFYMMNISPNQAVGEQYYSYIWLPFSIILVYAVYYIKVPVMVIMAYVTVLFVFCFQSVKNSSYVQCEIQKSWYDKANKADLLVIDSYDRCLLPRTLYFIDNNKTVFIGDINKMKNYESYNRVVVYYLTDDKKGNEHLPLSSYKLEKKEKKSGSESRTYYMESFVK